VRRVRERLIDDATSAFHGRLEPGLIEAALVAACPEIVGGTFVRTRQFSGAALVIFA
jgi:hypothetical protein